MGAFMSVCMWVRAIEVDWLQNRFARFASHAQSDSLLFSLLLFLERGSQLIIWRRPSLVLMHVGWLMHCHFIPSPIVGVSPLLFLPSSFVLEVAACVYVCTCWWSSIPKCSLFCLNHWRGLLALKRGMSKIKTAAAAAASMLAQQLLALGMTLAYLFLLLQLLSRLYLWILLVLPFILGFHSRKISACRDELK